MENEVKVEVGKVGYVTGAAIVGGVFVGFMAILSIFGVDEDMIPFYLGLAAFFFYIAFYRNYEVLFQGYQN